MASRCLGAGHPFQVSRSIVSSPLYSIPEGLENAGMDYEDVAYEDEFLVGSIDRFSTAPMVDEE